MFAFKKDKDNNVFSVGSISLLHQHTASIPQVDWASCTNIRYSTTAHDTSSHLFAQCHGEGMLVSHQLWEQAGHSFCKEIESLKSDSRIKNCPKGSQQPLNVMNSNGINKLQCQILQKNRDFTKSIPRHIKILWLIPRLWYLWDWKRWSPI